MPPISASSYGSCWPQAAIRTALTAGLTVLPHPPPPTPAPCPEAELRSMFPELHNRNKALAANTTAVPYFVALTHDEVAPAHHEAAGAHVHMAPRLQQANVFLEGRKRCFHHHLWQAHFPTSTSPWSVETDNLYSLLEISPISARNTSNCSQHPRESCRMPATNCCRSRAGDGEQPEHQLQAARR